MNSHFNQQSRQGRLTTILGQKDLVLLRFDGDEEYSGDFTWTIEALSQSPGIDFEPLLGTHATIEIDMMQGTRAFDGIVCEAAHKGPADNGWRYDLVLRPWLHVAGLRRNQRIFHEKTVVEIVEEVLADYAHLGSPHLDMRLTQDYPKLEYTVQYHETDADFIRRQLERFGISWFWKHDVNCHTLVLVDAAFSLPKVAGGTRPYFGRDGHHNAEEEHFRHWTAARRITTGAVRLTEYNFKSPNAAQEVDRAGDAAHPNGEIESFDWPGDYLAQGAGQGVVAGRVNEERGQAQRHHAEGDVVSLGAGWRVTLDGDNVENVTGRCFVCLKAKHKYRAQAYATADTEDVRAYDGAYVLMPDDAPLVPERRTRAPRVEGPETAVVVGEGEIDCDEFGRILVKFHWDLHAAHTMRVRVSQNWASKGWGGMIIPRIGMEVIVEHLRGDPDKPIVTGCVYNGYNMAPYELPRHKTRSTFKTDTHQGEGFNEIRFEDEKRLEEIMVHAQRDMNSVIRRDTFRSTGRHDGLEVQRDRMVSVGGNSINETKGTIEIASGQGTVISSGAVGMSSRAFSRITQLEDPEFINAKASLKAMESAMPTGGITVRAQTMLNEQVGMSRTTTIGAAALEFVGKEKTVQVGKLMQLKSGSAMVMTTADNFAVQAGSRVDIVCGKSSIRMTADGKIEIKGVKIVMDADQIDMN